MCDRRSGGRKVEDLRDRRHVRPGRAGQDLSAGAERRRFEDVLAAGSRPVRHDQPGTERARDPAAPRHRQQSGHPRRR